MMVVDSYPAFLDENEYVEFWKDYYDQHQWNDSEDLALYVHYPWCRSVCKFCVFGALKYNQANPEVMIYENAVLRMIEKMAPTVSRRVPTELFFGGGTPSLWTLPSLKRMTELIPNYDQIPIRRTEVHPFDLTPERIQFLIETMKFHHISIGVQSFNKDANIGQNRIPVDVEKLAHDVREFQNHGLYVNIDLVALFNGDGEENWDIFWEDVRIAAEIIKPDALTVSPNYKSDDYYGNSIEFRKIIKRFADTYPQYHINNGDIAFSTDYRDIMKYMDSSYIFLTEKYADFANQFPVLKENKSFEELRNRNIIGFGGMDQETAFSRTSEMDYLVGQYQFQDDEFRYYLTKMAVFQRLSLQTDEELYENTFNVGGFTLPPPRKRTDLLKGE